MSRSAGQPDRALRQQPALRRQGAAGAWRVPKSAQTWHYQGLFGIGSRIGDRAGSYGVRAFARIAKFPIVPVIEEGTGSLAALGREQGPESSPPPEPHVLAGDPEGDGLGERVPFYLTTSHGAEAIFAAGIPELWLAEAPGGAMRWGERRARKAALALADGWASTILQRLAAEPLAAAELDRAIEGLSGRQIRSCLKAMRASGQVEPEPGGDRNGARYALTKWGRECVTPLIASARMERRQIPEAAPIEELDVHGAFALALPLLRLPGGRSGECAMAVGLGDAEGSEPAAVTARFERGRLASWQLGVAADADARARGGIDSWFRAVIEGRFDGMTVEGDTDLAVAVLEALHERLFDRWLKT